MQSHRASRLTLTTQNDTNIELNTKTINAGADPTPRPRWLRKRDFAASGFWRNLRYLRTLIPATMETLPNARARPIRVRREILNSETIN
jgi:hypothetical protein